MLCYRTYTSRKNLSLVRKTFLICERHISARNVQRIAIIPHKIFIKALIWYISISHSPLFDIDYIFRAYNCKYLPWQGWVLHGKYSLICPWQSDPPNNGTGFVQDRSLKACPPPQDLVQEYVVHELHPPTMRLGKYYIEKIA